MAGSQRWRGSHSVEEVAAVAAAMVDASATRHALPCPSLPAARWTPGTTPTRGAEPRQLPEMDVLLRPPIPVPDRRHAALDHRRYALSTPHMM